MKKNNNKIHLARISKSMIYARYIRIYGPNIKNSKNYIYVSNNMLLQLKYSITQYFDRPV